eukprot:gene1432-12051_t
MKLVLLLVALCFVSFYVQSLPINCSSGATQMQEFDDVESLEVQTLFFRRIRKAFSKAKRFTKKTVKRAGKFAKKNTRKVGKFAKKAGKVMKKNFNLAGKMISKYAKKTAHYIKYGGTYVGKNAYKYGKIAANYIANGFVKSTLKIPFNSLNQKCQQKFVCAVDCSQFVPKCNNVVYFTDFIQQTQSSKKRDVFISYLNGCIRRAYDEPSEEFWMRDALVKYVQEAKQFIFPLKKVRVSQTDSFHNILVTIGKHPRQYIPKYLGTMAELFLSFRKMCHEDPEWKKAVEDRINQLLDNDKSIKQKFKGNVYLSEYFTAKLAEMKSIEKKFEGKLYSHYRASFEKVARNFKNAFIERVREGKNGYVCECPKFMKNNDNFPNGEQMAKARCVQACQGNTVSVLEEIEFNV